MTQLAWATDIHLDFLKTSDSAYQHWLSTIQAQNPAGVLLTGDIATAPTLLPWLDQVAADLPYPLYFVLGNHDYYDGSIAEVRRALSARRHPTQHWLGGGSPIRLAESTSLIGHSGWGDTRVGDFMTTHIRINDHRLISELSNLDRNVLQQRLRDLGHQAALKIKSQLEVCETKTVIVATHVPPFRSSTWYSGRYGDIEWMPDFCCGATGEVLLAHARQHPDQRFVVYCGHTHGEGRYQPLANLDLFTGKADYGKPALQGIIDVASGLVGDADRYLVAKHNKESF